MKRPFALVAVWVVAAAAAVGVGFLAVSLIDASASPSARPTLPVASSGTEAADPSSPPAGEQSTAGGTVYASCVGGTAQLAGAPAPGWTVETAPGQVEFRNGGQKIEVRADCASGSPVFTVEDGGNAATTPAPTSGAPASSPPGADDHGGDRDGGGHGSDD
jgi:hypothetical protein